MEIEERSVLYWSSGLESTLLLAILREQPVGFDILQFREMWTKEQKVRADALITEWNLKVFSYAPRNIYFVGQGKELSTVFDYGIPVLRDVLPGDRCIAELDKIKLAYGSPMTWGTHIIGSRKDDYHWALDQVIPSERFEINGMKFWAPLYDWTREQVVEKSIEYGLDITPVAENEDTGNISLCSLCLDTTKETVFCPLESKRIPTIEWNPTLNLRLLRQS
jgi:hypothetical protein